MNKSEWIVSTIKLATQRNDGLCDVDGIAHPKVPGLAVTADVKWFGHFAITHIPTGKKVAGPYERAANAQRDLVLLSRCADWTRDDLAEQFKAHGDESSNLGLSIEKGVVSAMSKRAMIQSICSDMLAGDEWPWEDESPLAHVERILAEPDFNPSENEITKLRQRQSEKAPA